MFKVQKDMRTQIIIAITFLQLFSSLEQCLEVKARTNNCPCQCPLPPPYTRVPPVKRSQLYNNDNISVRTFKVEKNKMIYKLNKKCEFK